MHNQAISHYFVRSYNKIMNALLPNDAFTGASNIHGVWGDNEWR